MAPGSLRVSLAKAYSSTKEKLAKALGFEPRLTVLETAVLPLTLHRQKWCCTEDSNPAPAVYKTAALPDELAQHKGMRRKKRGPSAVSYEITRKMPTGFEESHIVMRRRR